MGEVVELQVGFGRTVVPRRNFRCDVCRFPVAAAALCLRSFAIVWANGPSSRPIGRFTLWLSLRLSLGSAGAFVCGAEPVLLRAPDSASSMGRLDATVEWNRETVCVRGFPIVPFLIALTTHGRTPAVDGGIRGEHANRCWTLRVR